MLGQRHVKVTAAGHVIYEDHVPEGTGDLIVRAIQSGQRTIEVPLSETASQAALDSLQALLSQIDFKLNQLGSTAGVQSQEPLREQAEQHLNLPVGLLLQDLGAVYNGEH